MKKRKKVLLIANYNSKLTAFNCTYIYNYRTSEASSVHIVIIIISKGKHL